MQHEFTEQTPTADILLANLTGRYYEGLYADPPTADAFITLHLFGLNTCQDSGRDTHAGLAFWPAHFLGIIRGALMRYRMETDSGYARSIGETRTSIDRALAVCEARADLIDVILAAENAVRA